MHVLVGSLLDTIGPLVCLVGALQSLVGSEVGFPHAPQRFVHSLHRLISPPICFAKPRPSLIRLTQGDIGAAFGLKSPLLSAYGFGSSKLDGVERRVFAHI